MYHREREGSNHGLRNVFRNGSRHDSQNGFVYWLVLDNVISLRYSFNISTLDNNTTCADKTKSPGSGTSLICIHFYIYIYIRTYAYKYVYIYIYKSHNII